MTYRRLSAHQGRGPAAADYLRRDHAGSDSRRRVNAPQPALLTELAEVETAAAAFNPEVHHGDGFAVGQISELLSSCSACDEQARGSLRSACQWHPGL